MTHDNVSSENIRTIMLPLLALVAIIAVIAAAVAAFGIGGLMVPVLVAVPTIFVLLVWISLGKG
ncbi:hypothetical protein HCZ30_12885 [Marivivens donghaensis]|uniref:Uncharacterized protein n=1 Tax=Marivivens donghaensis TaxID=1699413 RepID=A0ABX0VZU1_9RHOB|nr:hypothetical protein [Marivivens donghaensis]NIY73323.1 hypothetical protein [Marivivens donghaensis]